MFVKSPKITYSLENIWEIEKISGKIHWDPRVRLTRLAFSRVIFDGPNGDIYAIVNDQITPVTRMAAFGHRD